MCFYFYRTSLDNFSAYQEKEQQQAWYKKWWVKYIYSIFNCLIFVVHNKIVFPPKLEIVTLGIRGIGTVCTVGGGMCVPIE